MKKYFFLFLIGSALVDSSVAFSGRGETMKGHDLKIDTIRYELSCQENPLWVHRMKTDLFIKNHKTFLTELHEKANRKKIYRKHLARLRDGHTHKDIGPEVEKMKGEVQEVENAPHSRKRKTRVTRKGKTDTSAPKYFEKKRDKSPFKNFVVMSWEK